MSESEEPWTDPDYHPEPTSPMSGGFDPVIGENAKIETDWPGPPSETGSGPDFPEDFQGAGPMFAAVPLGDPWHDLAVKGVTTYVVEVPGQGPGHVAGWAFLDRSQAEAVADAAAGGVFSRYEGLCRWDDCTPARAEAEMLAEPESGS